MNISFVDPYMGMDRGVFHYPRFDAIYRAIERCQHMSRVMREPQCISLEGHPGAGKTTLSTCYTAAHPRTETEWGSRIPVFYLETPSPITVKGMAQTMLDKLGDPLADRGTLTTLNRRLKHYLVQCEVQLVILDDFHHLIDADTDRVFQTVSDWLKVLIKDAGVPFMVVGIEGKNEQILRLNPQLSRLFALRETLRPFAWDQERKEAILELGGWIKSIEQEMGKALVPQMSRIELLHRLHYATDGIAGHLLNLLRYAAQYALEQGEAEVTLAALTWAFQHRITGHFPGKINPFGTTIGEVFVAPSDPPMLDAPQSVNRRSRQRKQPVPDARDVLRA
jgi:energy-coupling factor transporter ATP-binding protein EcfA2